MKSKLKLIELSYRNYYLRLSLLFSVFLTFISAWDFSFMKFWKGFVVLQHEFFHAIVLVISGGSVYSLTLSENEFGEVLGKVGLRYAIPLVYLSGYIGSIFLGFFLLHECLNVKKSKLVLQVFSIYTTLLVFLFTKPFSYAMNLGLTWSFALLFLSLIQSNLLSSLVLNILGVGISLYAALDLKDFVYKISDTDVGKLADWVVREIPNFPLSSRLLANFLALLILVISLGVVAYYFVKIFPLNSSIDEKELKKILLEYQKGNLSEDTANWFIENGLSLDGKKISHDAIKDIYKKGEMNE